MCWDAYYLCDNCGGNWRSKNCNRGEREWCPCCNKLMAPREEVCMILCITVVVIANCEWFFPAKIRAKVRNRSKWVIAMQIDCKEFQFVSVEFESCTVCVKAIAEVQLYLPIIISYCGWMSNEQATVDWMHQTVWRRVSNQFSRIPLKLRSENWNQKSRRLFMKLSKLKANDQFLNCIEVF